MTDRRTLEDVMIENGEEPPFDPVACPGCGQMYAPFALVDVEDLAQVPGKVRCGHCIEAAANETAIPAPEPEGWESSRGSGLKAERNMLLDRHAWTVRIDSPLSAGCQSEWLAWMHELHRMTIDHAIENWAWPAQPALRYEIDGEPVAP